MSLSSLSVPTDNIYKFACLFGLALVVSSVFAWLGIYSGALDRKTQLHHALIPLEAKTVRTASEDQQLALNRA